MRAGIPGAPASRKACDVLFPGMRSWVMIVMLTAGAAMATSTPSFRRGDEAPRATDLLRAQRLAKQAEDRLRTPSRPATGWKHGGAGWDAGGAPATVDGSGVTIRVAPPRR